MIKSVLIFLAISVIQTTFAQNINLELFNPHPIIQDADVGDMEFADIDGDMDMDLIILGKGGPILSNIYWNDGNGNLTLDPLNQLVNAFDGTIAVNDIDGDNDLDLVITGAAPTTPTTTVYLNDGAGLFTISTNSGLPPAKSGDIAFADVDNDNDDDLLITGLTDLSGTFITKLYLNNGSGIFTESTSNVFEALSSSVEFFDCDGDSDLDLVISGSDYSTVLKTILYKNDGNGLFTEVMTTNLTNMGEGDLAIGDSDNDGDLDILLSGNITATDIETELFLNDGMGNFTMLANTVFSDVSLGEVSFNDFDNDGDQDVFVLGSGEGGLINNAIVGNIYENLGNNNYIISDSLIGGYISSHAVGDINGDNKLDLILGGTTIATPVRATWLYLNETQITAGLEDVSEGNTFQMHPNPTQNLVQITSAKGALTNLTIFNMLGKEVVKLNPNKQSSTVDVSSLVPGIYVVQISTESGTQSMKLQINKE